MPCFCGVVAVVPLVVLQEVSACRLGDEAEALRCYQDAHRMFPANMDVISWLGAFHVKNEVGYSRIPMHAPNPRAPSAASALARQLVQDAWVCLLGKLAMSCKDDQVCV